jgi:hydroxyacylglutathione hydrolase
MKLGVIPVTPFRQNCSMMWDEETMIGALVDPGGDADIILQAVEEYGVQIEKILITHGHIDHAGAAAAIAERLGVDIEGPHRDDEFLTSALAQQGAKYGFRDARNFVPSRWLEDGDQVTVGPITLDVIHCPGHTPGHIVFYHRPSHLAFVGDVLFNGSIGRTDLPRGDHMTLINSIRGKLWPLGNDVSFVPGHGAMSTFGTERQSNPFVSDLVEY